MMKHMFIWGVLCLLTVSCAGGIDINGRGPGDNQGQIPGSDPHGSTDIQPQDTVPGSHDVVVVPGGNDTEYDGSISIRYSGNAAEVSGSVDGVTVTTEGARVTVSNSGDKKVRYVLSGSASDGFFKLYSSKKQAIVLNGLSLTNTKGAAINNQSKKSTAVVIEGTNALSDGAVDASGAYPEEIADEDMKASFFSEGQLIFSGNGSLTVSATGKAGITSDDYVQFNEGPTISVVSARGHGVRGKDAIYVSGGTISVTLESTAIGKKCFTTDSLMYISGGVTTLVNKASAGMVDSELTGAAGIKADQMFAITGGELNITASGKGCKCISGDKDGFFEGGRVVAKASGANYGSSNNKYSSSSSSVSSKCIKFDGNLTFSGAEVTASAASHEAIEAKGNIVISGGCISATSNDDAINSAQTMTISGGVVYAYSTGNDGLDANGNLIMKGGSVFAIGSGSPEVGVDANTEQGYKFYLQGGNLIALGGIERGSSVSQAVISTSWNRNTTYSLCDGDSTLFSFRTPSSGGSGLFISAPSLVSGNKYTLKTSATVSDASLYFDGILSTGGKTSGGNSATVTASAYTSAGGNTPGGGPGGPGGPGGWGW